MEAKRVAILISSKIAPSNNPKLAEVKLASSVNPIRSLIKANDPYNKPRYVKNRAGFEFKPTIQYAIETKIVGYNSPSGISVKFFAIKYADV